MAGLVESSGEVSQMKDMRVDLRRRGTLRAAKSESMGTPSSSSSGHGEPFV